MHIEFTATLSVIIYYIFVSIYFQELGLKLRPFEILARYDIIEWSSRMEPGGTLTAINALLVSICCTHTMSLYDARISISLSLTVFDSFIWSGISWSLKIFWSISCYVWLGKFGHISKICIFNREIDILLHWSFLFPFSFRIWIEICITTLHCAYQRFILAMMFCTEYLHTAVGAIKSPTFSVLYCTLLHKENLTKVVVFSH